MSLQKATCSRTKLTLLEPLLLVISLPVLFIGYCIKMSENKKVMSSNVLNMKFMRAAEVKEEEKKVEEKVMKLKDLSEWRTKGAEALKSKIRGKPKVVSVGYSNINALDQSAAPVAGRRVFGEEPKVIAKGKDNEQGEEENDIDRAFRLEKEEKEKSRSKTKRNIDNGSIPKKNKKIKSQE